MEFKLSIALNQNGYEFSIEEIPKDKIFRYGIHVVNVTSDFGAEVELNDLNMVEDLKKLLIQHLLNNANAKESRYRNIQRVLKFEDWVEDDGEFLGANAKFIWPMSSSFKFDNKVVELRKKYGEQI